MLYSTGIEKRQYQVPPVTRHSKITRPIRRLIEGRDEPLPNNWKNYLSLADNKADLAYFLPNELCSHAPKEKEFVVAGGFTEELEVRSSKGQLMSMR